MPPRKQTRSDEAKVRTLTEQLHSVEDERLRAIFESVNGSPSTDSATALLESSSGQPSPVKRKARVSCNEYLTFNVLFIIVLHDPTYVLGLVDSPALVNVSDVFSSDLKGKGKLKSRK
ncbi:hypothetical protein C0992_005974 [Termitomyces sp. T32_za158]|nr:hypothetical protein C0992_005974 [Termitomyces sp. T32_za158]